MLNTLDGVLSEDEPGTVRVPIERGGRVDDAGVLCRDGVVEREDGIERVEVGRVEAVVPVVPENEWILCRGKS